MFAYTELVSDEAPISMSAILVLDTMQYDMCSITFKDYAGAEIETWDNDQFIVEFCEYLESNDWSPAGIRAMIDKDGDISKLETDYIIELRNEITKLYNKAKQIGLI